MASLAGLRNLPAAAFGRMRRAFAYSSAENAVSLLRERNFRTAGNKVAPLPRSKVFPVFRDMQFMFLLERLPLYPSKKVSFQAGIAGPTDSGAANKAEQARSYPLGKPK